MVARVISKRSTVAGTIPLSSDLEVGELAINTSDRRIFSKHEDNTVFRLGEAEESAMNSRIDEIDSRIYSPFIVNVGSYFDQAQLTANASTLAGAANQFTLYPFIPRQTVTVDQIGVSVSTAVTGALVKLVIFNSSSDGKPLDKLWEGSNLSCASLGYVSNSTSFSFTVGRLYWLGIHTSSTAAFRSISLNFSPNLGLASNTGTTYNTGIRRTISWGSSIPSSWVFSGSEYIANITPVSFRMRIGV